MPNKYEKYRQRCIEAGKCPHCGQPCAPFYECAERRRYKNAQAKAKRVRQDKEFIDDIQYYIAEDGLNMQNDYKQAGYLVCFLLSFHKPVPSRICEITGLDFFFVKMIIDKHKRKALEQHGKPYHRLCFDEKAELAGEC